MEGREQRALSSSAAVAEIDRGGVEEPEKERAKEPLISVEALRTRTRCTCAEMGETAREIEALKLEQMAEGTLPSQTTAMEGAKEAFTA